MGTGARRRDLSETIYYRNPPCASRWSLTFWGLHSVPGDMFTLSVKPKGTLTSSPALLVAVVYVRACALVQAGVRGAAAPFPAAWPAGTPNLPGQAHQRCQNWPSGGWQCPRHPQPLHRLGVEGEELCHQCFSLCCSQRWQVVLSWWFCLLSTYLSDSMTPRIPLCSS